MTISLGPDHRFDNPRHSDHGCTSADNFSLKCAQPAYLSLRFPDKEEVK